MLLSLDPTPGPRPEFFFAPARMQKRATDWGPVGLQEHLAAAWFAFRDFCEGWFEVRRRTGREALRRAWADTVAGRTPPRQGLAGRLTRA